MIFEKKEKKKMQENFFTQRKNRVNELVAKDKAARVNVNRFMDGWFFWLLLLFVFQLGRIEFCTQWSHFHRINVYTIFLHSSKGHIIGQKIAKRVYELIIDYIKNEMLFLLAGASIVHPILPLYQFFQCRNKVCIPSGP